MKLYLCERLAWRRKSPRPHALGDVVCNQRDVVKLTDEGSGPLVTSWTLAVITPQLGEQAGVPPRHFAPPDSCAVPSPGLPFEKYLRRISPIARYLCFCFQSSTRQEG